MQPHTSKHQVPLPHEPGCRKGHYNRLVLVLIAGFDRQLVGTSCEASSV